MKSTATATIETRQAREAMTALVDWLDDNRSVAAGAQVILRSDLMRALAESSTLGHALDRPPAVAILAPLTPVTNRLVTTLSGARDPRLLGQFHGSHTRLPVVSGLLPPGDTMGLTGILRLTHDDPAQAAAKAAETVGRLMTPGVEATRRMAESSVRLEILTLTEVIKVLGRAYFANVKTQSSSVIAADIANTLNRALSQDVSPAVQPGLAAHQVHEIRAYLELRFRDHAMLSALAASGYWETFASLAPRATSEGRRRLASLIWGGQADFDSIYNDLVLIIEALNHNSDIVCPPEAVRSGDAAAGWSVAHANSVLAASTVLATGDAATERLAVRSKFGQPVQVSRAVLAALVREAAVFVEGEPTAVLASTDLLYLPTICPAIMPRNPRANAPSAVRIDADNQSCWVARAFVQAKTLYLAETTTQGFDATALVIHLDAAFPISEAFAPILADWVERSQGRTPAAREANDTTLFVALGAQSMGASQHSSSPLHDFLRDFGGAIDWLEHWGTGRAFDNVFILGAGQRSGTGPEVHRHATMLPVPVNGPVGKSTAISNFDSDLDVQGGLWLRHVRDTAVALDEALNSSDGGIRYLAQSIAAIDYRRAKRRQIATRLAEIRRGLTDAIRRYLLASNPSEDHDWRHRVALATQARLRHLASQQKIGRLIEVLSPVETDLRWVFDRVFSDHVRWSGTADDASGADRLMTRLAALEPIDDDLAARLAGRFATRTFEHWLHSLRTFEAAPGAAQVFGFNQTTVSHMVDEIVIGALRLGLRDAVAAAVARGMSGTHGSADMQASRAAMIACELMSVYVSQLGFDSPWSSRHPRRRGTLGAPLFERSTAAGVEGLANIQAGRVTLQYCSDWCEAFTVLTEENIASARGMPLEDGEFRELEELLSMLGARAFSG